MAKITYQRHRASISLPFSTEACGCKDKIDSWLHTQTPESQSDPGSATITSLSLDLPTCETGVTTGLLRGLNPLVHVKDSHQPVAQSKRSINVRAIVRGARRVHLATTPG